MCGLLPHSRRSLGRNVTCTILSLSIDTLLAMGAFDQSYARTHALLNDIEWPVWHANSQARTSLCAAALGCMLQTVLVSSCLKLCLAVRGTRHFHCAKCPADCSTCHRELAKHFELHGGTPPAVRCPNEVGLLMSHVN